LLLAAGHRSGARAARPFSKVVLQTSQEVELSKYHNLVHSLYAAEAVRSRCHHQNTFTGDKE
jgi:hypothetical protein